MSGSIAWAAAVGDALVDGGVDVAAHLPDSRLQGVLARLAERGVAMRCLTREEECVGYAAGRALAGGRPAVLMQCSGLGNSLNALGSLVVPYGIGLPLVLSMRGTLGEANPAQVPIGLATPALLAALAIPVYSIRDPDGRDAASIVGGVLTLARRAGRTAAVALEPELGGGRGAH
ncbi:thiamine pyrophosphate-binding protein [Pseudonocardia yuanmonensis]|uniref:Thiamine pyrophosphate-binding protein n=1 Tax=Pseudonocardia yuanmonensis TaxID=1095914 RepID=A0ABP8WPA0_9PSEU